MLIDLQCHDIRRGGVKDLVRLPQELFKTPTTGSARAAGYTIEAQEEHYDSEEDKTLNIHKPHIPVGRVDKRVKTATEHYHKATQDDLTKLMDKWIRDLANAEEVDGWTEKYQPEFKSITFLTGATPSDKDLAALRSWRNLRNRVKKIVAADRCDSWREAMKGSAEDRDAWHLKWSSNAVKRDWVSTRPPPSAAPLSTEWKTALR